MSTVAAEHQRPAFHRDANGKDLAIRIVRQDAGINIKPERTGSCPENMKNMYVMAAILKLKSAIISVHSLMKLNM